MMTRDLSFGAPSYASIALCLALAASGMANPAFAQTGSGLEAERAAVFGQMLDAPADRALMTQYARLSIEMRDYETAAATLERLIDLEPANATARLELATTYFAMGNYPLAEFHLSAATASGVLTADQLSAADAYQGAADTRDAPSRVSGNIALGVVSVDGDVGALGSGSLTWTVDLGDANASEWITQIGASTYALDDDPGAGDRQRMTLRTGPRFQLTGEAFGPRLQPYLKFETQRVPDSTTSDYDAVFVGIAYQNALSAEWTTFADASVGRGELDATGADVDLRDLSMGVTYRPSREALYRLTLSFGREDSATRTEDQSRLRLDYSRDFNGPAALSTPNWRAGAFASLGWRDVTDTGVTSDETVRAAGLSLRAYLNDDIYVETRGTHVARDGITDRDETTLSMQLGLEF